MNAAAANLTRILELVDNFTPILRRAFLASIADVRDNAELDRIVRALEAGDIDGALRAVHLDPASFAPMDLAVTEAYRAGGDFAVAQMPTFADSEGARVVVRFDARNQRAEDWLRQHSSELITAIIDDQRDAIRTSLVDGMTRGENPRTVALDIVGRINPRTRVREGGIVGLTAQQERFVANYAAELVSADAAMLRNALTRSLRDKRFDSTVRKAIEAAAPLDPKTAAIMVARYKASMLKLRGETIGRTEAMTALHAGQDAAYDQAIAKGAVKASAVEKVWSSAGDNRVRDSHEALDGQRVAKDGVFVSPLTGASLRYPGDPLAPVAETIQCRCVLHYRIDYFAELL